MLPYTQPANSPPLLLLLLFSLPESSATLYPTLKPLYSATEGHSAKVDAIYKILGQILSMLGHAYSYQIRVKLDV